MVRADNFEITCSQAGNILISYVGKVRLPPQVSITIKERDLLLKRDNFPDLCFPSLIEQDINSLAKAESILVYRFYEGYSEISKATVAVD